MWTKACKWHILSKLAVTLAIAGVIGFFIYIPIAHNKPETKIKLIGKEPTVEVFGPELPEGYDIDNFRAYNDDGSVIARPSTGGDVIYVYASSEKGSKYYHTSDCRYAYASAGRYTLYEAYVLGYNQPCGVCDPPLYEGAQ